MSMTAYVVFDDGRIERHAIQSAGIALQIPRVAQLPVIVRPAIYSMAGTAMHTHREIVYESFDLLAHVSLSAIYARASHWRLYAHAHTTERSIIDCAMTTAFDWTAWLRDTLMHEAQACLRAMPLRRLVMAAMTKESIRVRGVERWHAMLHFVEPVSDGIALKMAAERIQAKNDLVDESHVTAVIDELFEHASVIGLKS